MWQQGGITKAQTNLIQLCPILARNLRRTAISIIPSPAKTVGASHLQGEAKCLPLIPGGELLAKLIVGNPPVTGFFRCKKLRKPNRATVTSDTAIVAIKQRKLEAHAGKHNPFPADGRLNILPGEVSGNRWQGVNPADRYNSNQANHSVGQINQTPAPSVRHQRNNENSTLTNATWINEPQWANTILYKILHF